MNAGRRGGAARGRGAGRAALAAGAAGAAVLWAVVLAPPALADSQPQVTRVSMKDFTFNPATVTVQAGSAVEWTYDESATDPMPNCESPYFQSPVQAAPHCGGHSTTASDNGPDGKPLWDSGVHRADGFPFTHVFRTPGTYHYYCILHGGPHPNQPVTHMEGDIVVVAASSSGSGGPSQSSPGAGGSGSGSSGTVGAAASGAALPNTAGARGHAGLAGAAAFMLAALGVGAHHRRQRKS